MNETSYLELSGTPIEKIDKITRIRNQMVASYLQTEYAKELFKELDVFFERKIYSIELDFSSEYDDQGGTHEYCSSIMLGVKSSEDEDVEKVDLETIVDEIYKENGKGVRIESIHLNEDIYLSEEYEVREHIVDYIITDSFEMHEVTNQLGYEIDRPEGM